MAKNSSHTIAMHLFVYCLLVLCSLPTRAQQVITNLSADSLSKYPKGKPLQRLQWLYQSGDNQNWKKVTTKEQHWEKVHTNFGSNKPLANWNGMGWFRLWFKADSSLRNQMLALRINHDGASEIYLDGEKIGGYGKVASTKQHMVASRAAFHVIPFKINDHKPHLIAVRYSNHFNYFPEFIGFETWIGSFDQLSAAASTSMQRNDFLLISAGAQLALALLHIFLFAFYPKQKLNLYYSLFVLLSASTIAIPFIISDTTDPAIQAVANNVFAVAITLSTLAIGLLFYAISFPVLPKWRILIMSLMALGLLSYIVIVSQACECAVTDQMGNFFNMYYLLVNLDGVRAIIIAIRRKKPGVWLIGLGMFILSLFFFFVGADVFGWITSAELKNQLMSFGLLVMPLCFSLYLALDFARTNRNLSTKLLQVQQLSELNLAQEAEKLKLITEQAQQLEQTVTERTLKVQSQADKLREMDAVKSRFMINLTHEFRTPLTLILGPAKQILAEKRDPRTIMQASTIYRNADRLLQLINQMLDLSKLEAGKMELTNTSTELVGLVRRALLSFESLAIEKRIALQLDSYWDELWLWLDQDKFEKILVNLLSNSMKFTLEGGTIVVSIQQTESTSTSQFQLMVKDTGTGILETKLPYIFDRFYQADSSDTRSHEGTGIGLALTKELTELLGGTISVHSIKDKGTAVKIILPIQPAIPMEDNQELQTNNGIAYSNKAIHTGLQSADPDLPLILVVEDSAELRNFICGILGKEYRLLQAANGQEGLLLAIENIPDVVVTDLMMPLMDGYQVCSSLKQNEKTSHIPVIILTAKTDIESRIAGLDTQADAYLDKPFDERELLVTIKNLIAIRRQLQEHYSKANAWLTHTTELPSMEKVFLEKVMSAVELHLDDEQYSVELLAEDIGLSRTQLHRKLKGLIAQSPGDLIRIIRLQRAYELLKSKVGTVAEVSYKVGYGNPKNFSTSFSKHFGFSPSEASNH